MRVGDRGRLGSPDGVDRHPPPVDRERAGEEEADRPRQEPVLDRVEAREQRLLGVARENRDRLREDDRPTVERVVDQVDRHAGDGRPRRERVADGVGARERGQERRVDVEHAPAEGVEEDRPDEAHVPGEDDGVHRQRLQGLREVPVGQGAGVEAPRAEALDQRRVEPASVAQSRAAQGRSAKTRTISASSAPRSIRALERPQVAAAPGDPDRDPPAHQPTST